MSDNYITLIFPGHFTLLREIKYEIKKNGLCAGIPFFGTTPFLRVYNSCETDMITFKNGLEKQFGILIELSVN